METAQNCTKCGNPIDFTTRVPQKLAHFAGTLHHSPCSVCGLLHDEKGNKTNPPGHDAFFIGGKIELRVNGVKATSILS